MKDTYRITTTLNDDLGEAPSFVVQSDSEEYNDELIDVVRSELSADEGDRVIPVGATVLIERIA